jgi:hypothetical protein
LVLFLATLVCNVFSSGIGVAQLSVPHCTGKAYSLSFYTHTMYVFFGNPSY